MKENEFDEYFQEGVKRFQSGQFAESLEEFFNAAQIDSSYSALHYYIGEALARYKDQITIEPLAIPEEQASEPTAPAIRSASRYENSLPVIVVAYDNKGQFFAELAMTRVTSIKGAGIEMQRLLKIGSQIMIFTIDSRNAVPAQVRNLKVNDSYTRYYVGVEFLKGNTEWMLPDRLRAVSTEDSANPEPSSTSESD